LATSPDQESVDFAEGFVVPEQKNSNDHVKDKAQRAGQDIQWSIVFACGSTVELEVKATDEPGA
jgi:hypothetical protein